MSGSYFEGRCGSKYVLVLTTRNMARTVGQYNGKDWLDQTTICFSLKQFPSELLELRNCIQMPSLDLTPKQLKGLLRDNPFCNLDDIDDVESTVKSQSIELKSRRFTVRNAHLLPKSAGKS